MKLLVGQGMNNFIVEWNDHREEDLQAEGLVADDETIMCYQSACSYVFCFCISNTKKRLRPL
jgi:hypothetical protein